MWQSIEYRKMLDNNPMAFLEDNNHSISGIYNYIDQKDSRDESLKTNFKQKK